MKTLQRDKSRQLLGGVCAGIGNYLAVDTSVIRLLFVIATVFFGTGILVYLILWVVLPDGNSIYNVDAYGMPLPNPPSYTPPYQANTPEGMGNGPGAPYQPTPPYDKPYDNVNPTGPLPGEQPGYVQPVAPRAGNGRLVVGGLLIAFGLLMLVHRYIPEFEIDPRVVVAIALVGLGALLILRRR